MHECRRVAVPGMSAFLHFCVPAFLVSLVLPTPARAADPVTFNKDIAPILFAHCASCHRPGEIAPFSLLTYRDARQRLTQIADVTARRVMPPWKPGRPSHASLAFVDDRSLSDQQIQRIQEWIAQGAREGDRRDLPQAPRWTDGWQLGTPDAVVTMDAPFTLAAAGGDVFRTFVLPIATTEARYVRAIEFRPGNPRAVHHANLGVDRTRSSRRLDAADPEPGYVGGMVPDAAYPPGYMLGWTPGQRPRPSPDGMPWRLEPGSDVVVQLHLQPTGKPEAVQVSVGFFFTDQSPVRTPVGLRLGSETIEIPAGEGAYEVSDRYVLPVDVDLLAIQPHAHNLARVMEASVQFPDGTARSLMSIPDWDFRWQDVYRFQQPIVLPKGTTLSMRFTYDNSAGNPRNPFRPPQAIVWGQNTTNEMGDLWLQLVPRANSDLAVLAADIGRKTRAEDLAAYQKVLQADPRNPLRHDTVAMLNLQMGRVDEAIAAFSESLRLNPESAPTHYNLGLAFTMKRQYDRATSEFQNTIRIDPGHAEAHNNLGAMFHLAGQLDLAAEHYRKAFEIRPENAEAHNNLARLFTVQGQDEQAVSEFERARALTPDAPSVLAGLGWVRATARDPSIRLPEEAVRFAERAAELTGRRDAAVLDTLAAAYASAEQFEKAATTAREAMQVADRAGMQTLWVDIRERLRLYERSLPFRR